MGVSVGLITIGVDVEVGVGGTGVSVEVGVGVAVGSSVGRSVGVGTISVGPMLGRMSGTRVNLAVAGGVELAWKVGEAGLVFVDGIVAVSDGASIWVGVSVLPLNKSCDSSSARRALSAIKPRISTANTINPMEP